jgi:predicted  nucleic acid-binding Zn-ribbon protein
MENASKIRRPRPIVKTKLKSELLCRGCGATWKHAGFSTITSCPFCGKTKDARDRSAEYKDRHNAESRKKNMIEWSEDKENSRTRGAAYRTLLRKRVFFRISGTIDPACVRCGCDDFRFLEINHKQGGGSREMQQGKRSAKFYRDIANGVRPTEDLEILCRPCNAIHALELRFGTLPMEVVWHGNRNQGT